MIEGVTEYLPISSTGHLLIANRAMDVGQHKSTKEAADTYSVAIQAGAILAVLVLYRRRFGMMVEGALGRSPQGRNLLVVLVAAFLPAAVLGVALEGPIKDRLFGPWPVVFAWFVGGVLLLVVGRWVRDRRLGGGRGLEQLTVRDGLIIGVAQCLALWPGTSRSLVTMLAGLLVGASIIGAVEFSFMLGFVTLSAATAYDLLKHGGNLIDTFGWLNPLIGPPRRVHHRDGRHQVAHHLPRTPRPRHLRVVPHRRRDTLRGAPPHGRALTGDRTSRGHRPGDRATLAP